jgi:cellulose synthase/poly-beta-1,6-N-acetylglucosamine synthase-like glycosyltransferase
MQMHSLNDVLSCHINRYALYNQADDDAQPALTVSFVIPVFNSQDSISHTIGSLAKQERRDLIREIILVDDGSTDNSVMVIRQLQQQYPELPICLLQNAKRNYAAFARNKGIDRASGDLVCFIDFHKVLPNAMSVVVEHHYIIVLIYGDAVHPIT